MYGYIADICMLNRIYIEYKNSTQYCVASYPILVLLFTSQRP